MAHTEHVESLHRLIATDDIAAVAVEAVVLRSIIEHAIEWIDYGIDNMAPADVVVGIRRRLLMGMLVIDVERHVADGVEPTR